MGKRKLRRGRVRVFHKRRGTAKRLASALITVAVIGAGLVAGVLFIKYIKERPSVQGPSGNTPAGATTGAPADTTAPTGPAAAEPGVFSLAGMNAVYWTAAELEGALATDEGAAVAAAGAASGGRTAVVFDVRDADGGFAYASAAATAAGVRLPAGKPAPERLAALITALESRGLAAVPRIYALTFSEANRGDYEALREASARVTGSTSRWHDKDGRYWLNPYAARVRELTASLAAELRGLGAQAVLLDGVQFPEGRNTKAYFADDDTAAAREAALRELVGQAELAAGAGRLALCAPAMALVGTQTEPFGNNPLRFAGAVTVLLTPGSLPKSVTVGEGAAQVVIADTAADPAYTAQVLLTKIGERSALLPEGERPLLLAWTADGVAAAK